MKNTEKVLNALRVFYCSGYSRNENEHVFKGISCIEGVNYAMATDQYILGWATISIDEIARQKERDFISPVHQGALAIKKKVGIINPTIRLKNTGAVFKNGCTQRILPIGNMHIRRDHLNRLFKAANILGCREIRLSPMPGLSLIGFEIGNISGAVVSSHNYEKTCRKEAIPSELILD